MEAQNNGISELENSRDLSLIHNVSDRDIENKKEEGRQLIIQKIEILENVVSALDIFLKEIQVKIKKCSIANTVGNSASLGGTALLFTPLAPVGLGIMALGAITSVTSSVIQSRFEKSSLKQVQEAIKQDEVANERLVEAIVSSRITLAATQTVSGFTKVNPSVIQGLGLFKGAAQARQLAKFGQGLAVLGGVISVVDIVMTWTMDNATVEQIQKVKIQKEKELVEIKQLYEQVFE